MAASPDGGGLTEARLRMNEKKILVLLSHGDLESCHSGRTQELRSVNLLLVRSSGFIPNPLGSLINSQNETENKVQRDQKRQSGTKEKK